MCKCTPEIRTPFCGREECQWPEQIKKKENTVKIGEVSRPCHDEAHNPPSMKVWEPGVYEHTCPSCGEKQGFTVEHPHLLGDKK